MADRTPAWGRTTAHLAHLSPTAGLDDLTPEWAWGGGTGAGVRVGIVDSGIDTAHPAIAGRVRGYVRFSQDPVGNLLQDDEPHGDDFGHGTACADIILRAAPQAEIYSIKVLGARLSGKGGAFAAGLRWAIEEGMQVVNLSLGTTKADFAAVFHELADLAYFRNTILVTAANNMPVVSYPSLYASVLSVASHEGREPTAFYYNPDPPVEFLAPGIDVTVAWSGGGTMTVTGNSFSAPHIAGLAAAILGKHPGLTPFQLKTILRATARNVRAVPPAGEVSDTERTEAAQSAPSGDEETI